MDPDERARRREERRQRQGEESAAAETNGPTEIDGEQETNGTEDEEERLKREISEDKERRRNAEIERQRLEDEEAKKHPEKAKKKMGGLHGRVSKGRKKEILAMLLKRARGDLKVEEAKAREEKARYIELKVDDECNPDSLNKTQLLQLCEELHQQLQIAEGEKFDKEITMKRRDLQISNLKVKANETRGKFAMPTLKSVSKSTGSPKSRDTVC